MRAFFLFLALMAACCGSSLAAVPVLLIDVEPMVLPGNPPGYGPDFFAALGQETGLEFETRVQPAARVLAELRQGQQLGLLPEVDATLQRIAPVLDIDLMILPAAGVHAGKIADFSGLRVGRVRGGCVALLQLPEVNVYDVNTPDQGMRMLRAGRLDGFCSNSTVLGWQLKKSALRWRDFPPAVAIGKQNLWLMAGPDVQPAMLARLRAGVEVMVRKGRIKALHDKYHMGMDDK
ncbi:ABC-type amino acid transport substrate-binding protein [Andreprevotia lacus DSM 23236]|uniref:ABC-type amino acid transport substrate-binding protein n=1 Tax=Andreprevotia lacus DSM 23236 TaxID=1121001 RepID=A0A1W1XYP1_9NEIS|nr:transporter substrate-binding domain-containing protein [Andreprevotia lacus]SMC28984.1 ABC-type amino acid transport substrate-binding protein [Andreprevotia lacus DSM 23236]